MTFRLPPGDLEVGNAPARFEAALSALRLVKQLQQDDVAPADVTDQQRTILSRFPGFGDGRVLERAFKKISEASFQPVADVSSVLHRQEIDRLRSSCLTAFYTPLEVVRAVWHGLERVGLHRLPSIRFLDPSAGLAPFLGAAPEWVRERLERPVLVEKEPLTAAMARYLYPDAQVIAQAYEETRLPVDYFDVAISNVPFAQVAVQCKLVEKRLRACLHDYYFARTLRHVRPGGIVAFITSRWTLDKEDRTLRHFLARQCDLLGAFRLPAGTFPGTNVVADLVVLQRRYEPGTGDPPAWTGIREIVVPFEYTEPGAWSGTTTRRTIHTHHKISTYMAAKAEAGQHLIGRHAVCRGQHSATEYTVSAPEDRPVAEVLADSLGRLLPADVMVPAGVRYDDPEDLEQLQQPVPVFAPADARQEAWWWVYLAAKDVLELESQGAAFDPTEEARRELNRLYDAAVIAWGRVHDDANQRSLRRSAILPMLRALEEPGNEQPDVPAKAAIFTRRTVSALLLHGRIDSPHDALAICLDRRGGINLEYVASLCNRSVDECLTELAGRIFMTPSGHYETAEQYLSGDVLEKLEQARAAAEIEQVFSANVEALERVQPERLKPSQISVSLTSKWVPDDVMQEFVQHLVPPYKGKVQCAAGAWRVEHDRNAKETTQATKRWGSDRANCFWLLDCVMNGRVPEVHDTVKDGGKEKRVRNESESLVAQGKAAEIAEEFARWVWRDPSRERLLVDTYNHRFNRWRKPVYDGSYLTFSGMNADFVPHQHQRDGVAGFLQARATDQRALIHFTGAGKTTTMGMAAVKGLQLGLMPKVMLSFPNHVLQQCYEEIANLYPGWRDQMLLADPKALEPAYRAEFLARAAMGHYRIIFVAHSQFKMIPLRDGTLERFIEAEIADLERQQLEFDDDDPAYRQLAQAIAAKRKRIEREQEKSLKRREKERQQKEAKVKGKNAAIRRDDARVVPTWEQIGIGALFVDEFSDYFKNDDFGSKMRLAGVKTQGSQRSLDMRIKMHWLMGWSGLGRRLRPGRLVISTATPLTNSLAEAFILLRYLQQPSLVALGIETFDDFAGAFTKLHPSVEVTPTGDGYRVIMRPVFVNTWELQLLLAQCWHTVHPSQAPSVEMPELDGGDEKIVLVEGSDNLKRAVKELERRMNRIRDRKVSPKLDNPLKVTHEGRLMAYKNGVRWEDDRRTKLEACAEVVYQEWAASREQRWAQLIFCDMGVPKGERRREDDEPATDQPAAERRVAPAADRKAAHLRVVGEDEQADAVEEDDDANGESDRPEFLSKDEQAEQEAVYSRLRRRLLEVGIPAEELAFIQEHKKPAEKAALYRAVNEGRIRVLVASTAYCTGMNVQLGGLIAMHNLDTPWRPDQLQQRRGRIVRQLNPCKQVRIYNYITTFSFDAFMRDKVRMKLVLIEQLLSAECRAREIEDIASENVLTASEITAIATGNPHIKEKVRIETELTRLYRLAQNHRDARHELGRQLVELPALVEDARKALERHQAAITIRQQTTGHDFRVTLRRPYETGNLTDTYTDRKAAYERLSLLMLENDKELKRQTRVNRRHFSTVIGQRHWLGSYRGFDLYSVSGLEDTTALELQAPGTSRYTANCSEDAVGQWAAIEAALRALERHAEDRQQEIAQHQERLRAVRVEYVRPWEQRPRYEALREQLEAIRASLIKDDLPVASFPELEPEPVLELPAEELEQADPAAAQPGAAPAAAELVDLEPIVLDNGQLLIWGLSARQQETLRQPSRAPRRQRVRAAAPADRLAAD